MQPSSFITKVRNFRRQDASLSLYEALKIVFDREEEDPEHIVSNVTLVKRDVALGRLQVAFENCPINRDADQEGSVDDRGISPLKKVCDPEATAMTSSLDGGRSFNCLPDQIVEDSVRDLEGFSQDLSFGQVSLRDDTTITILHRSQDSTSGRDICGSRDSGTQRSL